MKFKLFIKQPQYSLAEIDTYIENIRTLQTLYGEAVAAPHMISEQTRLRYSDELDVMAKVLERMLESQEEVIVNGSK